MPDLISSIVDNNLEEVNNCLALIKSSDVDWSEAAEGEDPPIIWALDNRKEVVEILAMVS